MPPGPALARREREQELVRATRALFDERGMQEAPIEEIAKAVGIARGLIYRQFASKEELYVFTVTDYLAELDEVLGDAVRAGRRAARAARAVGAAYAGFCLRLPGVPRLHALAHAPPGARSCASCSRTRCGCGWARGSPPASRTSRRSCAPSGVEDPDYVANVLWTQILGTTHLARIGVGIRQAAPGVPELFTVRARAGRRDLRAQRAGDGRLVVLKEDRKIVSRADESGRRRESGFAP